MAINLNEADEQKEFLGAIPPDSKVKVRMTIRAPEAAGSDPLLTLSKNGDSENLNCEFEVIGGQFTGRKIWQRFTVGGVNDGHKKAAQISMRTMRAIVEAVRGISPKDASPAASQGRYITAWGDLQGTEFGVVVGVIKPQAGDRYINNEIKRILTVEDETYQHIMAGGEIISDTPIPEIPQAAQAAAPGWGAPKAPAAAHPTQGTLPTNAPKQSWQAPPSATPPAGSMPPPTAGGMPGWAAKPSGATADGPL